MTHADLLEIYAKDLTVSAQFARQWWKSLLRQHKLDDKASGFRRTALAQRWPDGPASHPRVLATIRKYWLACDELNQTRKLLPQPGHAEAEPKYVLELDDFVGEEPDPTYAEQNFVDPHIFVSEWLTDDYEELADFVGRLSYWPVGLDSQDNFT